MSAPSGARRLAVVAIALALAALLLRSQISSALVTRGDQLAFNGQSAHAQVLYARASALDPNNVSAVDRFAFGAIMMHDRSALTVAVQLLSRSLQRSPSDLTLRMDRALCRQGLRELTSAARDFVNVGIRAHDPRALMFAALDVASSDRRYSEHLLRLALAMDATFAPARSALTRMRRAAS